MQPLTPQRMFATRVVVLWTLRGVSVVLVAIGLYFVFNRALFALLSGMGFGAMLTTWNGVGEEHSLYRGLAMIAVGGTLAALSVWLANWIVPAWKYVCPGCGHEPPNREDTTRCPECGMDGVFEPSPRDGDAL